jgi:hypothetical protein
MTDPGLSNDLFSDKIAADIGVAINITPLAIQFMVRASIRAFQLGFIRLAISNLD